MDNKFESIITESRKRQLELFGKKKNKDTKSSNDDTQEKLDIEDIKSIVSGAISSDLNVFVDDVILSSDTGSVTVGVDKFCTEPIENFESNFNSIYKKFEKSGFSEMAKSKITSTDFNNGDARIVLKNKSGQTIDICQGYSDTSKDSTAILITLR